MVRGYGDTAFAVDDDVSDDDAFDGGGDGVAVGMESDVGVDYSTFIYLGARAPIRSLGYYWDDIILVLFQLLSRSPMSSLTAELWC